MGKAVIAAIPKEKVETVWNVVEPLLQTANDRAHGEETLEDIRERIDSGVALLLVAMEGERALAAFVAELITYPRRTICGITLCGGERADDWLPEFMPDIKAIAKEHGADSVRLAGRRGWIRKLAKYGWNEMYTVAEVAL